MISDAEKLEIEKAIGEAEQNTSGEIVAVIALASGGYYYVPYLWGALAALIVPWPLIYWTWMPVQEIYLIQLIVFAVLALVLHYQPLRFALVPRSVMRQRAHQRAMQQFFARDIYTTPGHTGVLLFVSSAERYAEIVTDAGIHAKVPDAEWQDIINESDRRDRQRQCRHRSRQGDPPRRRASGGAFSSQRRQAEPSAKPPRCARLRVM